MSAKIFVSKNFSSVSSQQAKKFVTFSRKSFSVKILPKIPRFYIANVDSALNLVKLPKFTMTSFYYVITAYARLFDVIWRALLRCNYGASLKFIPLDNQKYHNFCLRLGTSNAYDRWFWVMTNNFCLVWDMTLFNNRFFSERTYNVIVRLEVILATPPNLSFLKSRKLQRDRLERRDWSHSLV